MSQSAEGTAERQDALLTAAVRGDLPKPKGVRMLVLVFETTDRVKKP